MSESRRFARSNSLTIYANEKDITELVVRAWRRFNYRIFDLSSLAAIEVKLFDDESLLKAIEGAKEIKCVLENGVRWQLLTGETHRIDGPANIWNSGLHEWKIAGENITDLVRELLSDSPFDDSVHLGILAEYFAERDDFRLLDIVQPYLVKAK